MEGMEARQKWEREKRWQKKRISDSQCLCGAEKKKKPQNTYPEALFLPRNT